MDEMTLAAVQRVRKMASSQRRLAEWDAKSAAENAAMAEVLEAIAAKVEASGSPVNAPALINLTLHERGNIFDRETFEQRIARLKADFGLDPAAGDAA